MNDAGWMIFGVILAAIASLTTGCSGFEVGAKAGLYRVDTHSEASQTYHKPIPLKCYFTACDQAEPQELK